jgi:TonB family protein
MTTRNRTIAVATAAVFGFLVPVALAAVLPVPEPVIPELDRLANKDQPISVHLDHVTAIDALNEIAAAGGMDVSVEGLANCCMIDFVLIDVPLRRALELLAARTDARYEVTNRDCLRVWLPEVPNPDGEDGFTMPVLVKKVAPVYPEDARAVRAEGEVVIVAVIRWDGTIGNVEIMSGVAGWPSFDEAGINCVRGRRYQPAMKHGQPVSTYSSFRIRWVMH